MLLLRVNEVNDLDPNCSVLLGDPPAVQLRLMEWPLSADCGRATSRKQMNWDDAPDGELVGGVSLVLRPYRERKRTIIVADSQSGRVSR